MRVTISVDDSDITVHTLSSTASISNGDAGAVHIGDVVAIENPADADGWYVTIEVDGFVA
jgi:hypothetical protein